MRDLRVTDHRKQAEESRRLWKSRAPEERLDKVERLRIEAGEFLYEYPLRLRRFLSITRIERR